MHSDSKTRGGRIRRDANFRLPTIFDNLRETRHQEYQPIKIALPRLQVKVTSRRYGEMPSDLDRIKAATSSDEVVKVVNEVLEVLERCARIGEIAKAMSPQAFQSASELREAAQHNIGGTQSSNDADAIVQTVLDAAAERLRQLEGR